MIKKHVLYKNLGIEKFKKRIITSQALFEIHNEDEFTAFLVLSVLKSQVN